MGLPAKEENVLEIFFNEPSKHWHFTELVKTARVSKQQGNKWLKRFIKEKLITRIKPKKRMPYFIAHFGHPNYQNRKKLYALNKLYESGFLEHLQTLPKAKTVIIFGSYVRSDWHTESDIDIFIYGDAEGLKHSLFWKQLKRGVEPHVFHNDKEILEVRSGLMSNVVKGYLVKGDINDIIGFVGKNKVFS